MLPDARVVLYILDSLTFFAKEIGAAPKQFLKPKRAIRECQYLLRAALCHLDPRQTDFFASFEFVIGATKLRGEKVD